MDLKKIITTTQVVVLILAVMFCIMAWVSTSIARGLGGAGYRINIPYYYLWTAICIVLGLILALILRQSSLVLPIIGLMAFVALLIFKIIIIETTPSIINTPDINPFDIILILLPAASILGLVFNK